MLVSMQCELSQLFSLLKFVLSIYQIACGVLKRNLLVHKTFLESFLIPLETTHNMAAIIIQLYE